MENYSLGNTKHHRQCKTYLNRILNQEQIDLIHENTLDLLENAGVWIQSQEALEILGSAGCDVRDPQQVKIPRKMVIDAIEKAPEQIEVFDRNGKLAMTLSKGACYYGTGSDCTHHIDLYSGQRRQTKKEDVANLARFCDALPNIDFNMSMGIAHDTPNGTNFVHQYEAMLLNTTKPIIVTGHGKKDMNAIIDMAAAAIGNRGALKERPCLILYSEPVSPLTHSDMGVTKCLVCCDNDIPFIYIPSITMGGSGPVTIEGTLLQANVECLSGLVIFQNKQPGSKFIYGGDATACDMRQSIFSYGAPELNVLNTALADLAHYYKLPFFCIAGSTDSKVLDAQAGAEYAFSILLATMNGCNLIHDCGYLESGLVSSFESILMSDEIISFIKYLFKPLGFDKESMALNVIKDVGPGGMFLTHSHTMAHFRNSMWFPRFFDRTRFDKWEQRGSKDIRQKLKEEASRIFAEHQVPELPEEKVKAINLIVEKHTPDI